MGDTGLEPVTSCVSCMRASQLRQSPGMSRWIGRPNRLRSASVHHPNDTWSSGKNHTGLMSRGKLRPVLPGLIPPGPERRVSQAVSEPPPPASSVVSISNSGARASRIVVGLFNGSRRPNSMYTGRSVFASSSTISRYTSRGWGRSTAASDKTTATALRAKAATARRFNFVMLRCGTRSYTAPA